MFAGHGGLGDADRLDSLEAAVRAIERAMGSMRRQLNGLTLDVPTKGEILEEIFGKRLNHDEMLRFVLDKALQYESQRQQRPEQENSNAEQIRSLNLKLAQKDAEVQALKDETALLHSELKEIRRSLPGLLAKPLQV